MKHVNPFRMECIFLAVETLQTSQDLEDFYTTLSLAEIYYLNSFLSHNELSPTETLKIVNLLDIFLDVLKASNIPTDLPMKDYDVKQKVMLDKTEKLFLAISAVVNTWNNLG